jgi:hypothetical protein
MPTSASRPARDTAQRRILVATAGSLLLMAVLAPLAQFGVLQALIVPADAAATTANIAASIGAFSAAIAAFFVVVILDVVIAWGFYVLLRPVDQGLARIVAWLRVIYAAAFAVALLGLVEAARLVSGADAAALQSGPLQVDVAASVTSFDTGWDLALGVFGLHLLGLGYLLFRFAAPRPLAALVALAGAGYLADAIGTALVADYNLTIGTYTFVGEALLIIWLFWRAARGARSSGSAIVSADRAPATAA